MVKLSEKALNAIQNDPHQEKKYRISVTGIGWGGPRFGIVRDEQKENDYVENIQGITFLVDQEIKDQFGPFQVDYSKFFLTRGFYVQSMSNGSRC